MGVGVLFDNVHYSSIMKLRGNKKELVKNRSSHRKRSVKKVVLKNFAKFTGKHLHQSHFLIKLQQGL